MKYFHIPTSLSGAPLAIPQSVTVEKNVSTSGSPKLKDTPSAFGIALRDSDSEKENVGSNSLLEHIALSESNCPLVAIWLALQMRQT
jgi:hypothetical protein